MTTTRRGKAVRHAWTPEEDAALAAAAGSRAPAEVAAGLGRSEQSVRSRASRLGLRLAAGSYDPRPGGVLTPRQAAWLAAVDRLARRLGLPPSCRDLADELGVAVSAFSSPTGPVAGLVRRGFLAAERGKARTLRVVRRWDGPYLLLRGEWYLFTPAEGLS